MPKVELHVHLEGSIRPATLLKLAKRNGVALPADNLAGLQDWYRFRDFPHFVEIYVAISKCLRTAEDLELVMREFLEGQANQNILHTEFTFTGSTIDKYAGIPWKDQLAALQKGMKYGRDELGVSSGIILDIVRGDSPERGLEVANWATESEGVIALGLAGEEKLGSAQYTKSFAWAADHGLPFIPHAGETVGAESIEEVLRLANPLRIGHGVRCIENPNLMRRLAERQIPLEVCPTSNIALGIYPDLASHPLPKLLDEGLYVTINSDDPPMFGTTLSQEFERCAEAFDFSEDMLWSLSMNALNAAVLTEEERLSLLRKMREGFREVAGDHGCT